MNGHDTNSNQHACTDVAHNSTTNIAQNRKWLCVIKNQESSKWSLSNYWPLPNSQ